MCGAAQGGDGGILSRPGDIGPEPVLGTHGAFVKASHESSNAEFGHQVN